MGLNSTMVEEAIEVITCIEHAAMALSTCQMSNYPSNTTMPSFDLKSSLLVLTLPLLCMTNTDLIVQQSATEV